MNVITGCRKQRRRRGLSLMVVVAVMGITVGLLSVLVVHNVDMYRRLSLDRARCTARALSAGMADYAARHREELAGMPLDTPETLETSALTSNGMESQAEIRLVSGEQGYALRTTARVERGRIVAEEVRDLGVKLSP